MRRFIVWALEAACDTVDVALRPVHWATRYHLFRNRHMLAELSANLDKRWNVGLWYIADRDGPYDWKDAADAEA